VNRTATNALGQPIGVPVPGWTPPPVPGRDAMIGRYCRVEPIDPIRHGPDLHRANAADADGRMWTYLPYGPFADEADYGQWLQQAAAGADPFFHAIVDAASGRAVGVASYLRIDPAAGSIEVGHIAYSPLLQRSAAGTEAMFLMMRRAFELGYRRYEWKCDALNDASRGAAQRFGLSYEGIFRQARVTKGRNRDTAWYAAIDAEWPALRAAFETWLDPGNFTRDGRQRQPLRALTRPILVREG
jgi:RimJ/RimL family protein N-acetyltransferase